MTKNKKEAAKEKAGKYWRNILATRPMWGMIPLRVMFGLVLVLQGLGRFGFVNTEGAIINEWPEEIKIGIIVAFAVVEILGGLLAIPGFLARFVGLAIVVETIMSLFLEHSILPTGHNAYSQVLLFGIASMILFSGAGRYSIDRFLAIKLIKKYPCKVRELYCLAETPIYKW